MREMPEAQKRGRVSAPGICARNSGANSPNTVETCTPTFSNRRPVIIAITPPPPAAPVASVRVQGVRTKRPVRSPWSAAGAAPSSASNAAQISSRSLSNQALTRALRPSSCPASMFGRSISSGEKRAANSSETIPFSPFAIRYSPSAIRHPPRLPHGLADRHRAGHRHVEGAQPGPNRDLQPDIGRLMHLVGHAGGFASEQQEVACLERMVEIGGSRPRGEQDEPQPLGAPPSFEGAPRHVPDQRDLVEIVHAGAAERAIARRESSRLDEMRLERQTGGEPENRPGILRDVGLIKGDAHATGRAAGPASPGWAAAGFPAAMGDAFSRGAEGIRRAGGSTEQKGPRA